MGPGGVRRGVLIGLPILLLLISAASQVIVTRAQAAGVSPPLAPRFSIDGGAGFTDSANVEVGDAGCSPFFNPAVLVWTGGSIIGGGTVPDSSDLKSRTIDLLPHPCGTIESISSHALLSDMIVEAPAEVDPHHDPEADINVVLVMAGAGDIRAGRSVAAVYADLQRYCTERRAAGFKVIVLTLLPRRQPEWFEGARLALNALVRESWTTFADGLDDVAADRRIGDTGDNFDRQYYGPDSTHPNAAGYAVMATITAPLLNGLAWRSSGCETRYSNGADLWSDWCPYAAGRAWQLSSGDGVKSVLVQYRDEGGRIVSASDSVFLDTVSPKTVALRNALVRSGATATLAYRVTDARPCALTADVVIRVRNAGGVMVRKLSLGRKAVATNHTARFRCRLPRGSYTFYVHARDAAGNSQSQLGNARLMVN